MEKESKKKSLTPLMTHDFLFTTDANLKLKVLKDNEKNMPLFLLELRKAIGKKTFKGPDGKERTVPVFVEKDSNGKVTASNMQRIALIPKEMEILNQILSTIIRKTREGNPNGVFEELYNYNFDGGRFYESSGSTYYSLSFFRTAGEEQKTCRITILGPESDPRLKNAQGEDVRGRIGVKIDISRPKSQEQHGILIRDIAEIMSLQRGMEETYRASYELPIILSMLKPAEGKTISPSSPSPTEEAIDVDNEISDEDIIKPEPEEPIDLTPVQQQQQPPAQKKPLPSWKKPQQEEKKWKPPFKK